MDKDNIAALMEGFKALIQPPVVRFGLNGYRKVAFMPNNYAAHDMEQFRSKPTRIRQEVDAHDLPSFIAYCKSMGVCAADLSKLVYADKNGPLLAAVLDYHKVGSPEWCDHTITYKCPLSDEWKTWTGRNGKAMPHPEFAQFIEDNLPDIVDPPAARMLEVARHLEAKKTVTFSTGNRIQTGDVQITYEEVTEGTSSSAKGNFAIPDKFSLGIPVFDRGPVYKIECRLRYRIADGRLSIWFELYRSEKVFDAAFEDVVGTAQRQLGIQILRGHI